MKYISSFTECKGYIHRVNAWVDGKFLALPLNPDSIAILFHSRETKEISTALIDEYGLDNKCCNI